MKRFGEAQLVPVGIGILTVGLFLLPLAPPPGAMVAVFMLIAVGQGIASPSLNSLISQRTKDSEQGFVLGTNQSMSALARTIGPAWLDGFTWVVQHGHFTPAPPYWASASSLHGCEPNKQYCIVGHWATICVRRDPCFGL